MASALAHLLNFIFRRMPVIEDTAKERAQNASRRPPRLHRNSGKRQDEEEFLHERKDGAGAAWLL